MVSVPATYGAILLGGFVAAAYVGFTYLLNTILTSVSRRPPDFQGSSQYNHSFILNYTPQIYSGGRLL